MRDLRFEMEESEVRDLDHRFDDLSLKQILRVVTRRALNWNTCAVGENLELETNELSRGYYEILNVLTDEQNIPYDLANKIADDGNRFGKLAEQLEDLYYQIQNLFPAKYTGESGETAEAEQQ